MLRLALLLAFAALLPALPASAGYWEKTYMVENGTYTLTQDNTMYSGTWGGYSNTAPYVLMQLYASGNEVAVSVQGTIKRRFTWHPDPFDFTDNPPPTVKIRQNGGASWSASRGGTIFGFTASGGANNAVAPSLVSLPAAVLTTELGVPTSPTILFGPEAIATERRRVSSR